MILAKTVKLIKLVFNMDKEDEETNKKKRLFLDSYFTCITRYSGIGKNNTLSYMFYCAFDCPGIIYVVTLQSKGKPITIIENIKDNNSFYCSIPLDKLELIDNYLERIENELVYFLFDNGILEITVNEKSTTPSMICRVIARNREDATLIFESADLLPPPKPYI
jgi:hypothetical protein